MKQIIFDSPQQMKSFFGQLYNLSFPEVKTFHLIFPANDILMFDFSSS